MKHPRLHLFLACAVVGLFFVLYFAGPVAFSTEYQASGMKEDDASNDKPASAPDTQNKTNDVVVTHLPTPKAVKAIYMSQCVAGTKNFREELAKVADTTEINSIVIDIKDYSGRIGFIPENPILKEAMSDTCRASDVKTFIADLHRRGIYIIGRITVFQDPYMTHKHPERAVKSKSTGGVWKDNKGLSFIDVGSRDHWEYIVALSKESYAMGFDELNYDYIRYPSDGPMSDAFYSLSDTNNKPEMLKKFFMYLHDQVKPTGAVLSADLFGMTTTSSDDLNIGQVLENALPYFDYIAPMVYPSHYPKGFNGFDNPNKHVYEVIHVAMGSAVDRVKAFYNLVPPKELASASTSTPPLPPFVPPAPDVVAAHIEKLRPWLQDFDYGGNYDIAEVQAQIKATYDVGLTSWMLWAPSNKYTVGALKAE